MRRNRFLAMWALLAALVLIAAGCQGQDSGEPAAEGGLLRVELSEPGSLDPPNALNSEEIIVVTNVFEGLVIHDDKTAQVRPGMATKWEQNDEATRFTFNLRRDAKFSNGEPVTAQSFVRGWTRATAKAEAAKLAYHLAGIEGYREHHDEGSAADLSGVVAKDDHTLEVTLSGPDADFVTKTAHTPFMPIPADETIGAQEPSWAEFPIGNGPFMLKGPEPWKHNQSITMVPNSNYAGGREEPKLDEVRFVILADFDTAYAEWQAGNLDWTRIPPPKLKEAESQNRGRFLKETASAGLNYLDTVVNKAPTDNKLFRQAVSLAIDRKLINETIFNGLQTPADSIIPPVMPGYTKGACEFCRYDPAMARQLLEQSGVKVAGKLPVYFNSGSGHEQWVQAVADQIKTNLGIETEVMGKQPFSDYLNFLRSDDVPGSVNRLAWSMDYPTPQNFLYPLLHSASTDNYSKYNNPEFEALLTKATRETDTRERLKIYQEAEALALEDMPIIPLWFRAPFRLARLDKFGGLAIDVNEYPTLTKAFVKAAVAE